MSRLGERVSEESEEDSNGPFDVPRRVGEKRNAQRSESSDDEVLFKKERKEKKKKEKKKNNKEPYKKIKLN